MITVGVQAFYAGDKYEVNYVMLKLIEQDIARIEELYQQRQMIGCATIGEKLGQSLWMNVAPDRRAGGNNHVVPIGEIETRDELVIISKKGIYLTAVGVMDNADLSSDIIPFTEVGLF